MALRIIQKNFRFLKTCSFKWAANNPELVKSGKIIYVRDSYGVIFPYICPNKVLTSVSECDYTEKVEEEEIQDDSIIDELCEMPTYMVHELLSKYKDKPSFYEKLTFFKKKGKRIKRINS